jgi:outer membrane receptor protein involved in Fe transport
MILRSYTQSHMTLALLLAGLASVSLQASAQEERAAPAGTAAASDRQEDVTSTEIIVTAQKRDQRLQDVPVPVSVLNAESLTQGGQNSIQSYFSSVPGLNMQVLYNRPSVAIRGLTTGATSGNPIVAYIIDDAPFGSSTSQGTAGVAPDVDPSDLQRIEVLRGPQGTLYGASSLGGLLKYVTIDPSFRGFSGSASAGVNAVRHGDVGYHVRGAVNVPVSDTFAFRVSAFSRETPGYIDNVITGEDDVNKVRVRGVNFAALWRPSEDFSLRVSALHQSGKGFGSPDADQRLGLGSLRQTNTFGAGRTNWENNWVSATMKGSVGKAELTSVSSYSHTPSYTVTDLTYSFGSVIADFFPGGYTNVGAPGPVDAGNRRFTQEIRMDLPIGEKLDWLVGGFYSRERGRVAPSILGVDPTTGAPLGVALEINGKFGTQEYAAFTDLTVKFSDQLNLQVGGRIARNSYYYYGTNDGPFVGGFYIDPKVKSKDTAKTYLVTLQYTPTRDTMIYTRVASGFRPGGINGTCKVTLVPCNYAPDETVNYEIGAKGNLLGRALSYDVSVYYIDWKDIQLGLLAPNGFPYSGNAGNAKSKGVELSLESRPTDGLTLSGWIAWNDATLKEGFPAGAKAYAVAGDRLPYSSRWSGKLSADANFPLTDTINWFGGASLTYVGERLAEFVPSAADAALRQKYPAYVQADLNLGIEVGQWRLTGFVNNVTDRRGLVGGGFANPTTANPNWLTYTQPRTIGLSIDWKFD